METTLEVLFTPADFAVLKQRDLAGVWCVVFDVLRATSSMITALANGAVEVVPVAEIPEALEIRRRRPEVLLAGERDGLRIRADASDGVDFDLGNSPREFTPDRVAGKSIVITTTNGTRALRACLHADRVLAGAFLNLRTVAELIERERPSQLLLIGSGTFSEAAYEDVLAAGALCELIWGRYGQGRVADSALIARKLYGLEQPNLLGGLAQSRNGRRLLARPELRDDVAFCAQCGVFDLVPELGKDGVLKRGCWP